MEKEITQDKKTRTKNAILEAAKEAFLSNGYHKTDMGQIASAVGIDKRTIYRYFESKEALAFVIWQDVLSYVMSFKANAVGDTGYEKLNNMLSTYMSEVENNKNLIKFLGEFDHVFSGEYPEINEAKQFVDYISHTENVFVKYIKEGIEDKSIRDDLDAKLTASTISNILLAISQRVVIRGDHLQIEQGYSKELLYSTVSLLLNGIKNKT